MLAVEYFDKLVLMRFVSVDAPGNAFHFTHHNIYFKGIGGSGGGGCPETAGVGDSLSRPQKLGDILKRQR